MGAGPRSKRRKSAEASGIDRAAELVREANARVHETARQRETPGGIERWHAALAELDAATYLLYPRGLRDWTTLIPGRYRRPGLLRVRA